MVGIDNFVMLTGIHRDWQHLLVSLTIVSMSPDGASMQSPPSLSPSSLPVIPTSWACPMRLNKQIGHFIVAVIGKRTGLCYESISPAHGSQTGCLTDISDVNSADNLPKPTFLTPGTSGLASISGVRLHVWTLSEVLQIHLHSQLLALGENRLTTGMLNSYCDYCGVAPLWDIKSKYIQNPFGKVKVQFTLSQV